MIPGITQFETIQIIVPEHSGPLPLAHSLRASLDFCLMMAVKLLSPLDSECLWIYTQLEVFLF